MSDLPVEGKASHPVSLDPWHNVVNVGWGAAPIVALEVEGEFIYFTAPLDSDADQHFADPIAPLGVIPKSEYEAFSTCDPDYNFTIGLILASTTRITISAGGGYSQVTTINGDQYFAVKRRTVLYNFAHCKGGMIAVFGTQGDSYLTVVYIDGTRARIKVHETYPVSILVKAKAYSRNAVFTLNSDGSITSPAVPIWSFDKTIPSVKGSDNTDTTPATIGATTYVFFDRNGLLVV